MLINYLLLILFFIIVKPQIVPPENYLQTIVGPSINNISITYTAKSPGNENITWYHNDVELSDRLIHQSHDMGGSSTVQVSLRGHKGKYRVVVKSLFNGLPVPDYITEESNTEYSFEVDVTGIVSSTH